MADLAEVKEKWLKMTVADQIEGVRDLLTIADEHIVTEEFEFWDARVSKTHKADEGRIMVELFWAGEIKDVRSQGAFQNEVRRLLGRSDVVADIPVEMREGGCMMPLCCVALSLDAENAEKLGDLVFEDFGNPKLAEEESSSDSEAGDDAKKNPHKGAAGAGEGGKDEGCKQQ
eukprot:TRINITY_DN19378_c0_g1_i1.p2 TRINITY_DN19378_c0_g1~~TRINITY_DN19378_c0_g1_i1.p2  ORF type:complete len:173 (-),score=77.41 TRINITY_DN19378_c0_g1_i1:220-738(-)